jgi:hypothetical protein
MDYKKFEEDIISDIEKNWVCSYADAQSVVTAAGELVKKCYASGDSPELTSKKIMVGDVPGF